MKKILVLVLMFIFVSLLSSTTIIFQDGTNLDGTLYFVDKNINFGVGNILLIIDKTIVKGFIYEGEYLALEDWDRSNNKEVNFDFFKKFISLDNNNYKTYLADSGMVMKAKEEAEEVVAEYEEVNGYKVTKVNVNNNVKFRMVRLVGGIMPSASHTWKYDGEKILDFDAESGMEFGLEFGNVSNAGEYGAGIIVQVARSFEKLSEYSDKPTFNYIPVYLYGIVNFNEASKTSPGLYAQLGMNFFHASNSYRDIGLEMTAKGGFYCNFGVHMKMNNKAFLMAGYQYNGGSLNYEIDSYYGQEDIVVKVNNSGMVIRGGFYLK